MRRFYWYLGGILALQVIVLFGIEAYSQWIATAKSDSKECGDIMNRTLFQMRFCIWNILHIIIFFGYCLIMKPVSAWDHAQIFAIGVVWYLMQYVARSHTSGDTTSCPDVAYDNMLMPRLDDFVYNSLGQLIYVLWVMRAK